LAAVATVAGRRVTLWGRDGDHIAAIGRARENARYLPGIALPEFAVTDDLAAAAKADAMLLAMPAQTIRAFVAKLPRSGVPLVLCAKGIEKTSGKLLSEVLGEAAPDAPLAILSGPSFAREVAMGLAWSKAWHWAKMLAPLCWRAASPNWRGWASIWERGGKL